MTASGQEDSGGNTILFFAAKMMVVTSRTKLQVWNEVTEIGFTAQNYKRTEIEKTNRRYKKEKFLEYYVIIQRGKF